MILQIPPFAPKTEQRTRVLLGAGPAALTDPHWRKLIASFQEVAFMERSERWHALGSRIVGRLLKRRNGTTAHLHSILSPRADRYYRNAQKELKAGGKWRAWGSAK